MSKHKETGNKAIRFAVVETTEERRRSGTIGSPVSFHATIEGAMVSLWTERRIARRENTRGEFSVWVPVGTFTPCRGPARLAPLRPGDWEPYGEHEF